MWSRSGQNYLRTVICVRYFKDDGAKKRNSLASVVGVLQPFVFSQFQEVLTSSAFTHTLLACAITLSHRKYKVNAIHESSSQRSSACARSTHLSYGLIHPRTPC